MVEEFLKNYVILISEYPEKVRQKLMSAETSHDITRILIQARHEV